MPQIKITLHVRAAFVEESHRELIIDTVRQSAQHVLTNIVWLTPTNNKIQPSVIMAIEETGEEKREVDISKDMAQAAAAVSQEEEDPFGAMY